MITKLGFYWDDWSIAYYIHFHGPASFREAFVSDRPLMAWIYLLTTSLFRINPLNWQIFAILMRWFSGLALWWMLRGLWPKKIVLNTAIVFLFIVYPGFRQQHIAITYGNAFVVYGLFLFSLATLVWAYRNPKLFWLLFSLSLVSTGLVLFTTEYFVGLEFLRPIFLWIIFSDSKFNVRQRIKRVILNWLPYAFLMFAFLFWRLANVTPRAKVTIIENLNSNPISALLELGKVILEDLLTVTALAWKQTLNLSNIVAYEPIVLIKYIVIILVAGTITVFYLLRLRNGSEELQEGWSKEKRRWALQAITLGLIALFVSGIPIWVTNLQISLLFPWDRFTLPMMIGASLLIVGLVEMITWKRYQRAILIGIAIGVAAGMHFQTALEFRKDWLLQRDFFWQLTWRVPGIQSGTTLLTSEMPFPYDWDNSLTLPLNWTYAPDNSSMELQYLIYNVESRLSSGLPDLHENMKIKEEIRNSTFNGSTSQSILIFYRPPGSCLKVIDPIADRNLPEKPRYFRESFSFSDPSLIVTNANPPALPIAPIFYPEPEHDWCYYFEKADLAHQQGNWEEVTRLGDQAQVLKKEFFRKNVSELLPFIEGYAQAGRLDEAVKLSIKAHESWKNMQLILCDTWKDIQNNFTTLQSPIPDDQMEAVFIKINQNLKCSIP